MNGWIRHVVERCYIINYVINKPILVKVVKYEIMGFYFKRLFSVISSPNVKIINSGYCKYREICKHVKCGDYMKII